jgi:excisionase family DNA binding protein
MVARAISVQAGDDAGTRALGNELRPFLTRCEVADLLRVSERTVRRMECEGRLQSLKLTPGRAGRVLFRREELLRFVAEAESQRA